jgi:predicted XRE-type DNA-binding protein
MVAKKENIGSDFDEFLDKEGIKDDVEATAIKRVITFQLQNEMKKKHISKTVMAKRMHTSRSAIDRLFDPENDSLTLATLNKAAHALGKQLKVQLV